MATTATRRKAKSTTERPKGEAAPDRWVLRQLGIVGYDHLEPVILAALAEEAPLLLIGAHGTAKSLLLNRLAQALGLVHRHYNASLLNFDDLVGFPQPSADRKTLEYIQTPATIWDAESVFLDEISRCRPDLQNKLFPVIHERVVQGIPLPRLRHRWAAMNPPSGDDDPDSFSYTGSEPLDPALADRFAWIVWVPGFEDLSEENVRAILNGVGESVAEDAPAVVSRSVAAVRALLPVVSESLTLPASEYVQILAGKLEAMKRPVSPRRGRQMVRNIVAVHAARLALGEKAPNHGDSAFSALRCSMPHGAYGSPVDDAKLLVAHRAAWELVRLEPSDPTRIIQAEKDPVKRLALAVSLQMDPLPLSGIVTDVLAGLEPWEREALAVVAFPVLSEKTDLTASAYEMLAGYALPALSFSDRSKQMRSGGREHILWKQTTVILARRDGRRTGEALLHNLALSLIDRDVDFEPERLTTVFDRLVGIFGVGQPGVPS